MVGGIFESWIGRSKRVDSWSRPADVDAIENEIEIMQRIRGHGNILSLYEYYRSNTTVQLVLQYCEGGEVLDAIAQRRGLSENEAKVIMKQTFDALRHCHMMNICHRDLKPQNLLLRTSIESGQQINERTAHVVICDFSVSTIVSNQHDFENLLEPFPTWHQRSFTEIMIYRVMFGPQESFCSNCSLDSNRSRIDVYRNGFHCSPGACVSKTSRVMALTCVCILQVSHQATSPTRCDETS